MGSDPKSMRILLGGGSGHTGSRLLRRLLAEGHAVLAVSRSAEKLAWARELGNLHIVQSELRDAESRQAIAEAAGPAGFGCDAFIQIANIAFAEETIEIARAAGISRVIQMSSTRRFTRFPDAVAERVIRGEAALEAAGLESTILRPSMIYGGPRDNNLQKIMDWMRRPVAGRVVPMTAGGRARMQPIFVDDLVEAIMRTLARPEATSGRALTLAGLEPVTWREMIQIMAEEMIRTGLLRRPPWMVNIPYPCLYAVAGGIEGIGRMVGGRALVRRDQIRRLMEDKVFDINDAAEALGGWRPRSFREGIREKAGGMALAAEVVRNEQEQEQE